MIKIIDGDLLEATEDVIGHQVNCQMKMGSGVTLQIKNKYPKAYHRYCDLFKRYTISDTDLLLGHCQIVKVNNNKWIANLFGQFNYGYDGKQYTETHHLNEALSILKKVSQKYGKTVALPYKIGSDRGGADWDEVYAMIDGIFSDYEVTLYRK